MKNPKQTIVEALRSRMNEADRRRIAAIAEVASTAAGAKVWSEFNAGDGIGSFRPNPYNTERARAQEQTSKEAYEEAKAAYYYAVDQFIETRRWVVKVYDCVSKKGKYNEYRVSASTKTDAAAIAFAIDSSLVVDCYWRKCKNIIEALENSKHYTSIQEDSLGM